MKKETLMDAINNIDPDIIEKSVNYRPKVLRRNVTRIAALAACLALLVTSIPMALMMSRRDETEPPKTTESETTKPNDQNVIPPESFKIIYCCSEDSGKVADWWYEKHGNRDVEIRDINDFNTSEKVTDVEDVASIPAKLYVTHEGKTYSFSFRSAQENHYIDSTDEHIKSLAYKAKYYMDDKPDDISSNLTLYYNYVTGRILQIDLRHDSKAQDGFEDEVLTQEQIDAKAQNDVKELLGIDLSVDYKIDSYFAGEKNTYNYYSVNYMRYIGGYGTMESVSVRYNSQGELVSVSTAYLGLYDAILPDLDEESIKRAEAEACELIEKFGPNYSAFVIMRVDGKAYIRVDTWDPYNSATNKTIILEI